MCAWWWWWYTAKYRKIKTHVNNYLFICMTLLNFLYLNISLLKIYVYKMKCQWQNVACGIFNVERIRDIARASVNDKLIYVFTTKKMAKIILNTHLRLNIPSNVMNPQPLDMVMFLDKAYWEMVLLNLLKRLQLQTKKIPNHPAYIYDAKIAKWKINRQKS